LIRCVVDIEYLTGLRKGDILKIHLLAISDTHLFVRQNKTGAKQNFELTSALRAATAQVKAIPRRIG